MRCSVFGARASLLSVLAITFALNSCGGDGTTEPPGPDEFEAASETNLSGATGAQVGPLVVEVTDSDGDPKSGVSVNWAVTAGSGTLSYFTNGDLTINPTESSGKVHSTSAVRTMPAPLRAGPGQSKAAPRTRRA